MATGATIGTYIDAAITAIGSGDWATAEAKLLQAETALVGVPDTKLGDDEITWGRAEIQKLRRDIQQRRNASAGIRQTKITYARPSD